MKGILKHVFLLIGFFIILTGCMNQEEAAPDKAKYAGYDKAVKEYFMAYVTGNYDVQKKYFLYDRSDDKILDIQDDIKELESKEVGTIEHPEFAEKMGERYEITAFNLFADSHNQMLYLTKYYDPSHKRDLTRIFTIEQRDGKYIVFDKGSSVHALDYDIEEKPSLEVKELEKMIQQNPDHAYLVHAYSEQ